MCSAPAPYGFSFVPASYDGAATAAPTSAAAVGTGGPGTPHPWKESSFSFHDVLDALNPLQHLPIVNTIYRWATGDIPGNIARVVGDGIYGGPIGLATGMISVAIKDDTGKDPGEMAMALLTGDDAPEVKLGSAAALPAPAASAAATAAATSAIPVTTTSAIPVTTTSTLPVTATPALPVTATAALPATATFAAARAAAQANAAAAVASMMPGSPAPMMPPFRTPPSVAPAAATASPAEQAFSSENGALLRSAYGQRPPPAHAMVPLQLTGAQLPQRFPRNGSPVVAPATNPGSATPTAAPQPGSAAPQAAPQPAPTAQATPQPDLSALPENPPVDIPQRMMEALDKYAHIQPQPQRGQQVDVNP